MDQTLSNVTRYHQRTQSACRSERRLIAEIPPGLRVLEIGCGDGRVTKELLAGGSRVWACDLNLGSLRELVRRADGRRPAAVIQADARRLPVADGSFDVVVFAFNGIDFVVPIEGRISVLREIERVLARNGSFIFSSHNPIGSLLSPRGFRREWRARLALLRSGTAMKEYREDAEGLFLYQARPGRVVRQVTDATTLRFQRALTGRSGLVGPLWAVGLVSKWPYYVFRKPVPNPAGRATGLAKRSIDVAGASIALAALAPVFALVSLLILVTSGRPILFRQHRTGIRGRIFTMFKFRTMRDERSSDGSLRPDGERLTRLGRVLRALSLDELPELFNVVRGDMSLVGPRPLLPEYLDRYTPEQGRRHEVLPGVTGWAQVRGRNALTWEEKFALDVWYVDNRSLALDVRILARTAWQAIRGVGVSQPGHATMPEFLGPPDSGGAGSVSLNGEKRTDG